jgi:hypothetical protein
LIKEVRLNYNKILIIIGAFILIIASAIVVTSRNNKVQQETTPTLLVETPLIHETIEDEQTLLPSPDESESENALPILETSEVEAINTPVPTQTEAPIQETQEDQEQEENKTTPVSGDNGQPGTPIFGIQTHDFSLLPVAAQADNYWVRYNALLWSDYQPEGSGQFIRSPGAEERMLATSQAGMEMILIVRGTPGWAQKYNSFECGPMAQDNLTDFAAFLNQLVKTYSAPPYNVKYYEIWNEPDAIRDPNNPRQVFGCWGEPEDPYFGGGYYAEMLKAVYPAVKAADPEAKLVLGGLLMPCDPRQPGEAGYCPAESDPNFGHLASESRFFEGILQAGGGAYFDYVNFHGFNLYEPWLDSAIQMERHGWWGAKGGQIEGKLDYLREMMSKAKIDKPIFLTEVSLVDYWSYSESEPDFDFEAFEAAKADYVVWLYTRNMARGVYGTTWYHLGAHGWRMSGLLDKNNQPLPAFNAFQVLSNKLNGVVYQQDLRLGEGILGFEFSKGAERIWVVFSEDGQQKTITPPTGFIRAYDLFDNPLSSAGGISFDRPIYIELKP